MSVPGTFVSSAMFQRRRLGLLLILLGGLAVAGGAIAFQLTPPSEPIAPVTTADLRNLDRPESLPHPYISFHCKHVVDTRVVKSGRGHRGRAWKAYYYLLPVEDRWIVAHSSSDVRPGQVQGRIVQWDMPVNVSALRGVLANLKPADRARVLPVQLNVGDYRDPPTITGWRAVLPLVMFAGGLCVLVGLYKFATSFGGGQAPVVAQEWSFSSYRR